MRPIIISDTKQVFNGAAYYLCGQYFQRDGVRLHRVVWEAENGMPVPDGYHVHHKDEDRANNNPENLQLLEGAEHLSLHGKAKTTDAERAARARNAREFATPANRMIPREKRSAASKAGWNGREPIKATCQECGGAFDCYRPTVAKFCSAACSQRDLRERRKATRGS